MEMSDTDIRNVIEDAKRLVAEFHESHTTEQCSDFVKWLTQRIGEADKEEKPN